MLRSIVREKGMSLTGPIRPLIAILGATGTGKSELAVTLAERYDGEVINADALQLYEGLPITTNKLTERERRGIKHHLLGSITLREQPWTVKQFHARATAVMDDIWSRKKVPILVGGTAYYLQSLLVKDSLVDDVPAEDLSVQPSEPQLSDKSTAEMLEQLKRLDPVIAARWHPSDRRKIQRSLEICQRTGRKASEIYAEQRANKDGHFAASSNSDDDDSRSPLLFWTHSSSEQLSPRLDKRVDDMVGRGLLAEAEALIVEARALREQDAKFNESHGIWTAIGYKELVPAMLESPRTDARVSDGIARIKIATRQYVKRQVRWLRLKLMPALKGTGMHGNTFLLDSSDLESWSRNVVAPAADITARFLEGKALPDPMAICTLAKEMLSAGERPRREARLCKPCGKTLMSEAEWTLHVKGKAHQANTRKKVDWKAMYPPDDRSTKGTTASK